MSFFVFSHVAGVVVSLAAGLAVIGLPKRLAKTHRLMGRVYLYSMLATNVSALLMYEDTGGVGTFHILAVISLVTLGLAYWEAKRRSKNWMIRHGIFMSFSYVGLVAAGVSRYASSLLPAMPVADAALVISGIVTGAGAVLIFTLMPGTIRRMSGRARAQARRNVLAGTD